MDLLSEPDTGDVTVIGPECFASADGSVISWRGRNYVLQSNVVELPLELEVEAELEYTLADAETFRELLRGVDLSQLEVTVTYGIFNDPQVWERRFTSGELAPALRPPLLETPLYEDDSPDRTLNHARLMNDDRRLAGTLARDGMVLVKRQVTLRSGWLLDVNGGEG